jgi:hypothetical protein
MSALYTDAQIERFWRYVEKGPDCWLWRGEVQVQGYGQWQVTKAGGKRIRVLAHRAAWELEHGGIPDGKQVRHRCHVRLCVRPDHLLLGTAADNSADMVRAGRSTSGERNPQSRLTWDEVRHIRDLARSGLITTRAIALSIGMSPMYVGDIINGKAWKVDHGSP